MFTSHNGFTDDPESAFRHIDTISTLKKGRPFDETAPYDCFQEKEEREELARNAIRVYTMICKLNKERSRR